MQNPTCTNLRVRSPADAQVIFHAVSLNILPMVTRRLDTEERRSISSGCVFVWEERGPNAEATGLGIERWTDGIRWGPSRVRDEFLFYHEKDPEPTDLDTTSDSDTPYRAFPRSASNNPYLRDNLIKQTYSVFVETTRGRRKWHLIAYFTQDSLDYLRSIDDMPQLASLPVPPGKYKSARSAKGRPRDQQSVDHTSLYPTVYNPKQQYAPYTISHDSAFGPLDHHHWTDRHHHQVIHHDGSPHHAMARPVLPRLVTQNNSEILAPLTYLQNIPPLRRHPLDEKALMSFSPTMV